MGEFLLLRVVLLLLLVGFLLGVIISVRVSSSISCAISASGCSSLFNGIHLKIDIDVSPILTHFFSLEFCMRECVDQYNGYFLQKILQIFLGCVDTVLTIFELFQQSAWRALCRPYDDFSSLLGSLETFLLDSFYSKQI